MNNRIFIVDDDPFWTEVLKQMLGDIGYTNIFTYTDGMECLQYLHLNPSIVFLDYQMDHIDGIEVLKRIKAYYPGIGVIFCTAHEDLSVAVDAMENGSYDYLLKGNATIKEVKGMIEKITDDKLVQLTGK